MTPVGPQRHRGKKKRDKVTGECRKLYIEALNDLSCLPKMVRVMESSRMRLTGHVAPMGARRGVYRILAWKLDGRRTLGRPKLRWEDNI